ncbi:response regulator [Nannocystaceae bacterium ST9]
MSAAPQPTRRILVVEDNHDAADCLTLLLEMEGHEVQTAYDGLRAVEIAGSFTPDAVILDIGLPKLNGYDAARRIRQQLGDAVVLIAMSGWEPTADRDRPTEPSFDHHMVKPIELDALTKLLEIRPIR